MFGWLRWLRARFFWLRRRARQRLFLERKQRDEHRGIYFFRDDAMPYGWHAVDPVHVVQEMEKAGGEEWGQMFDFLADPLPTVAADATDEDRKKLDELSKRREWAGRKLAESVCPAFGVKPFDQRTGKGMTVLARIELLRDFLIWLHTRALSIKNPLALPGTPIESK